jgi:glycerol-1-phosphate dehydrogenase [NAD(P)+]
MLESDKPPVVKATKIDPDDMVRRMGPAVAAQCLDELKKKAFDETATAAFNERLQELWPTLRQELKQFMVPVDEMQRLLKSTGGPISAAELGTSADFYREAVVHCREMRNRFSFLDIAADAGMLEDFARGEA